MRTFTVSRFPIALYLLGLPGIALVTVGVLPEFIRGRTLPVPLWVLELASGLQSMILLALAVFAGVRLSHRIGLSAPILESLSTRRILPVNMRNTFASALVAGVAGAVLLTNAPKFAPPELIALQTQVKVPVLAGLLYGGITEELLLRWGFMTFLAWLLWRLFQRGAGIPKPALMWCAIVGSAVLFGLGHLPAVSSLVGHITFPAGVYIVVANAAFGLVAGWTYWRKGLEAAIGAHSLAHLLAALAQAVSA
jgi:membrane protease YdiL (CAAX protease family)